MACFLWVKEMENKKEVKNTWLLKYKPEYAEQAYKLCLLGATDSTLADFFNVEIRTINRWKHDYEEFKNALDNGKIIADSNVAKSLYNRANGAIIVDEDGKIKQLPPDTTACIFWLKNRQSQKWRDKVEQEVKAEVKAEVSTLKSIFEDE